MLGLTYWWGLRKLHLFLRHVFFPVSPPHPPPPHTHTHPPSVLAPACTTAASPPIPLPPLNCTANLFQQRQNAENLGIICLALYVYPGQKNHRYNRSHSRRAPVQSLASQCTSTLGRELQAVEIHTYIQTYPPIHRQAVERVRVFLVCPLRGNRRPARTGAAWPRRGRQKNGKRSMKTTSFITMPFLHTKSILLESAQVMSACVRLRLSRRRKKQTRKHHN